MQHFAIALLVFAVAIATALALRFRRVRRQAATLREAADRIANGHIDTRARLSLGPLSPVGKSFDNMACYIHEEINSLKESQSQLEHLVVTDRLTGVGNRRAFDAFVAREVAVMNRYGVPASLIMLDIDHFKRLNDDYGHSIGDQVLVGLTRRIASRLRDTDAIFRWGGEEFAIVTPCTPISGAQVLAESLRTCIAEQPFETVGTVTISLGLAQLLRDETAAVWVAHADHCLYESKRCGRNRVSCSATEQSRSAPFILVWGEQFLTQNSQVDAEHAEVFRLANELILLHPLSSLETTLARLDDVLQHLRDHFAAEEAILGELSCVELPRHAAMHRGLLAQAKVLRQRLIDGEVDPFDVGDFIVRRVAVGHLVNADLPLFASLCDSAVMPIAEAIRPSMRLRLKQALSR